MINERVSEKINYPSRYVDVLGSKMHYIEAGSGDPIVLLHGIPTSSYLWRNVIPHLSSLGRCIAPDLIGLGLSDKPNIEYSIFDHVKYIEKFIEALKLKNIVLIMHGWGSLIGFHYAMTNEKNCKALAFYEAFLRSLDISDVSLPYQEQLITLQNVDNLADIVMNGSSFVDLMIPQTIMRTMSETEMEHYRKPFMSEGAGKPILQYLKELPNGLNKNKIDKLIDDYSEKLTQSKLPKLLLYTVPGFITTIATVIWAKENLPNLEIVEVGEELHLVQETNPKLMGETISVWLQGVEQSI